MNIDYKEGIKKLVEEYRDTVEEIVKEKNKCREKIENNNLSEEDYKKLLERIVRQILNMGTSATAVETQISKFKEEIGNWNIENILNNIDKLKIREKKNKEKLEKILKYIRDNSIRDWIIKLHNNKLHNKDNNTIPTMGLKSDDDFLKELGFYEHVPIDRHIKRFLFRTGIIHWYFKEKSEKGEDILTLFNNFNYSYRDSYRLFQKIMKTFCKEFCDDITICGLKLSENPGILDMIIWRHCGRSRKHKCKNICGSKPKCNKCVFKESCLYYLLRFKP